MRAISTNLSNLGLSRIPGTRLRLIPAVPRVSLVSCPLSPLDMALFLKFWIFSETALWSAVCRCAPPQVTCPHKSRHRKLPSAFWSLLSLVLLRTCISPFCPSRRALFLGKFFEKYYGLQSSLCAPQATCARRQGVIAIHSLSFPISEYHLIHYRIYNLHDVLLFLGFFSETSSWAFRRRRRLRLVAPHGRRPCGRLRRGSSDRT